jgi:predicted RNase H-like HicB family nuclease
MTTQSYLVVYEKGEHNWSGYSPQVPGCISAGETLDEMRAMMTEALEFHLANLLMDGDPIPEPVGGIVDFSDETPANGVEHCHVEWLPVRISCEFAGKRSRDSCWRSP